MTILQLVADAGRAARDVGPAPWTDRQRMDALRAANERARAAAPQAAAVLADVVDIAFDDEALIRPAEHLHAIRDALTRPRGPIVPRHFEPDPLA